MKGLSDCEELVGVTFHDGSIIMGEFIEDQPWEAIYFDKDMKILNKWEDGIKKPLLNNFR